MSQLSITMPKAVKDGYELLAWLNGLCILSVLCLALIACRVAVAEPLSASETAQPLTGVTPASKSTTAPLAALCQNSDPAQAGPAMVVIKPGRFRMGSPNNDPELQDHDRPQHLVTIPKPFALSRCEITVGQFRQFIKESSYQTTAEQRDAQNVSKGCYVWDAQKNEYQQHPENNWVNPGFVQTEQHPVVCVSWEDVQRYVDWLSQRSGALYRQPTEAEWEYAARAGTVAGRYYVPEKQCGYANGADQSAKSIAAKAWALADCDDGFAYTAPVASLAENHWGLFDMLGNVWEWTQDCWHGNYQGAPVDGNAWLVANQSDCVRRVVRGGSWGNDPLILRSANRYGIPTDEAFNILGFRVARAL